MQEINHRDECETKLRGHESEIPVINTSVTSLNHQKYILVLNNIQYIMLNMTWHVVEISVTWQTDY